MYNWLYKPQYYTYKGLMIFDTTNNINIKGN